MWYEELENVRGHGGFSTYAVAVHCSARSRVGVERHGSAAREISAAMPI
jgi:hypothetical protein